MRARTSRPPTSEAVLEPEVPAEPFEQGIALADLNARVGAREHAELDDLGADERQGDEPEHRVDLPRAAEDVGRARVASTSIPASPRSRRMPPGNR